MTLLITLAHESVIHQSSDYCLSNWAGKVEQSANGTKQLSVAAVLWTARLAFTGVAFDNQTGYRTLDWLQEEALTADQKGSQEDFVGKLAHRGTEELRRVPEARRKLTVLARFVEAGRCRLFLISNFEEPRKSPLSVPQDSLHWFEIDLSRREVLVNGTPGALPRHEKRRLEQLFRGNAQPQALRERMAAANRAAAGRPGYKTLISKGCWVSSLFADGKEDGWNSGEVPGVPSGTMYGFDVGEYLRKILRPAPGKQIALRQSVSMHGAKPVPLPPPTGEPREVRFTSPTTSAQGIGQAPGAAFPRVVFEGQAGVVSARKYERVTAVLGTVSLEIDPQEVGRGVVALEQQRLSNAPIVEGAQAGGWDYVYDLHGGGGAYTLQVHQNSTSFRGGQVSLGEDEELVFAAPVGDLTLHATPEQPKMTGEVVASFLVRDSPPSIDGRIPSGVTPMKTRNGIELDTLCVIGWPKPTKGAKTITAQTTEGHKHLPLFTTHEHAAKCYEAIKDRAGPGLQSLRPNRPTDLLSLLTETQAQGVEYVSFDSTSGTTTTLVPIQAFIDDVQEVISREKG